MSNEAAEEIARLGMPVIFGLGATVVSGFVLEAATDWSEDFNAQHQIGFDIQGKQAELEVLESANLLVGNDPEVQEVIQTTRAQISELQTQSDQFGNEALNFGEAYGLPLALGVTLAVLGLRRAIRQSALFGRQS